MINFFRKIRENMIKENRVSKYILYAIGEIVLVVIGILIALSINNWNEQKKTEEKTKSSLLALRNDLILDTLLINKNLPEIKFQLQLNESLRARIAKPKATLDTLIQIARYEFNPNWNDQILYNTNAYKSLNQTGLIENLPDTLKTQIKNFYNRKFQLNNMVERITTDYRSKLADYVDAYTFGSTSLHDQGPLIDSLVWQQVNPAHLAAKFQGISNFKRILFSLNLEDMENALNNSRILLRQLNQYLNP
jgi:type II secretory pathway pseudopilin PulG